jgi:hypothetical protein
LISPDDDKTVMSRFFDELDAWRGLQDEVDLWPLLAAADRALAQLDRVARRAVADRVA